MIVSCLQTPVFENLGKHLQLHRFNTCLPTTTIFPIYITDILVLLLAYGTDRIYSKHQKILLPCQSKQIWTSDDRGMG